MAGVAIRFGLWLACAAALAGCGRSTLVPTTDPADGPVRGGYGVGFSWATQRSPTITLDPVDARGLRDQVGRSQAAVRADLDDAFSLAIVATFPSATTAEAEASGLRDRLAQDEAWFAEPDHADALRDLLDPDRDAPISGPATAWLTDANLAPGTRGLGWAGGAAGSGEPVDAVWTMGRTVVVTGLKAETATSAVDPPIHPIAHRWAAAGAEVLIEGDRAGEGAIFTDVSCTPPDAATGAELRDAIGDTIDLVRWSPRPPWVGPPTDDQAATRREIATYLGLAQTSFEDPALRALLLRMATAGEAERRDLLEAIAKRTRDQVHAVAAGRVSDAVLQLMERQPDGTEPGAFDAWNREVGQMIGTVDLRPDVSFPTADAYGPVANYGTARFRDGRLDLGTVAFGRASTGLPLLVAWLDERGCRGIRVGFADSEP
jgi:hypothetical protein